MVLHAVLCGDVPPSLTALTDCPYLVTLSDTHWHSFTLAPSFTQRPARGPQHDGGGAAAVRSAAAAGRAQVSEGGEGERERARESVCVGWGGGGAWMCATSVCA